MKIEGDRLVLVGHSFMTLILLALAIIALIEKSRAAFLIWLVLLILFIALPLILLKFVPKIKKRFRAVEKRVNAEKKKQLPKKKAAVVKKKLSFISKIILKLKSFLPKQKYITKVEKTAINPEGKPVEKPAEKKKEEKPSKEEMGGPIKIEPLEEKKHVKEKAETNTRIVKTDFDRIIEFVDDKKDVSITDIAKHFNLPKEKIEEWAKILSEHNLIEIIYPTFGEARIKKKEIKADA